MNVMADLERRIKEQAYALGFELAGIAPVAEADGFDRLRDWLAKGFAGDMGYMQRQAEARRHPASILPQVKSVLMVALNYAVFGAGGFQKGADGRLSNAATGLLAPYLLGAWINSRLWTRKRPQADEVCDGCGCLPDPLRKQGDGRLLGSVPGGGPASQGDDRCVRSLAECANHLQGGRPV